MHHAYLLKIIGPLFLVFGWVILYKISENRFNRRSVTGMELFSSFRRAFSTRLSEGCAAAFAKILIFIGIVLIVSQWI